MNGAEKSKRRVWTFAAFALALLLSGYTIQHFHRRSFDRLGGFLGFDLPPTTELSDYTDDFALSDFSQSWLVRFPSDAPRPWESSSSFHECFPHPKPSEDYPYIRGIVHANFPAVTTRFQHPRIWRGGHKGNCYIASSDGGAVVFFHYFAT